MDDDVIRNDPNAPKVVATLTITLLSLPGGLSQTKCDWTGDFNEQIARFLLSKGSSILDDFWKQQNAPRVLPGANGYDKMARRMIG